MSSQSSSTSQQQGLGHSAPLVTIPARGQRMPPGGAGAAAAVGSGGPTRTTDHPLAFPPAPAAPVAQQPNNSNTGAPLPHPLPPPPRAEVADPSRLTEHHQQQLVHSRSSSGNNVPPSATTPSVNKARTLEDLADAFLSGPSARTDQGLPPLLRPAPLPADNSANNANGDLERLRVLAARRAWGDVLTVAQQLLRQPSSPYAPVSKALLNNILLNNNKLVILNDTQKDELVEIMTLQCQSLLKMRRYNDLKQEIEQWSFCHHINNTAPSWIPWSLHILAATSLSYTTTTAAPKTGEDGGMQLVVDALWSLRTDIPKDEPMARIQLETALSNTFVKQREWRLALECLENITELLPSACAAEVDQLKLSATKRSNDAQQRASIEVLKSAYRCQTLARQGRILLQVGALKEARLIFKEMESCWVDVTATGAELEKTKGFLKDHPALKRIPAILSISFGLAAFAGKKFEDAFNFFRKGIEQIRQTGALSPPALSGPIEVVGLEPLHVLYAEAINNMALCALYTCRLSEALHLMETLVREDPTAFLTERVAFNLCTLYELGSDPATSSRKKRVLQLISKRFFLHDIGPESFRIS